MIAAIWILLPFAPTLSLARHTTQKSPVPVPPQLAVSPDSPSLVLVSRYARYAEEALSQSRATNARMRSATVTSYSSIDK
jgi:hypothetical protein